MLSTPAPYPYPGSYALLVDTLLPQAERRAELVRIVDRRPLAHGGDEMATVSFPLRPNVATGHRAILAKELVDGTPLTKDEEREMHDLQRAIRGRKRSTLRGQQKARADALLARMQASFLLSAELTKLERAAVRAAHRTGSPGQLLDTRDRRVVRSAA